MLGKWFGCTGAKKNGLPVDCGLPMSTHSFKRSVKVTWNDGSTPRGEKMQQKTCVETCWSMKNIKKCWKFIKTNGSVLIKQRFLLGVRYISLKNILYSVILEERGANEQEIYREYFGSWVYPCPKSPAANEVVMISFGNPHPTENQNKWSLNGTTSTHL